MSAFAMRIDQRIRLEFWRYLRRGYAGANYHMQRRRHGRPSLTAIMDYHGSDKGSLHGYGMGLRVGHRYSHAYDELFASGRDRAVTMLEIGIGPKQPGVTGAAYKRRLRGSVTAWREYFPAGQIHASDIVDCRYLSRDRLTIHVADQSSRESMDAVARAIGAPLDIVLDDGSHASAHQQISLASLLPHLADDAIYVIEDLEWQPAEIEDGSAPKTLKLMRTFEQAGKFPSPVLTAEEQHAIEDQLRVVRIEERLGVKYPGVFVALRKQGPRSSARSAPADATAGRSGLAPEAV